MSETAQKATGIPTVPEMLAVLHDLHRNYAYRDAWAFFGDLRLGTGFRQDSAQTIDAFAVALWPSKGSGSYAYEIKVSRSDFLRELKQPLKRRLALRFSNMFWFVTPEGLVRLEEVPIECGLLEVRRNQTPKLFDADPDRPWRSHVVVPAPWRDVPAPTWNLFAAVARRVQRLEQGNGR